MLRNGKDMHQRSWCEALGIVGLLVGPFSKRSEENNPV